MGRRRCQLRDEEFSELEARQDGALAELSHVVLVAATDALDETEAPEAFEVSGNLAGAELRQLPLQVSMAQARDRMFAASRMLRS